MIQDKYHTNSDKNGILHSTNPTFGESQRKKLSSEGLRKRTHQATQPLLSFVDLAKSLGLSVISHLHVPSKSKSLPHLLYLSAYTWTFMTLHIMTTEEAHLFKLNKSVTKGISTFPVSDDLTAAQNSVVDVSGGLKGIRN